MVRLLTEEEITSRDLAALRDAWYEQWFRSLVWPTRVMLLVAFGTGCVVGVYLAALAAALGGGP